MRLGQGDGVEGRKSQEDRKATQSPLCLLGFPISALLNFGPGISLLGVGLGAVLCIIGYLSIFQVSANTLPSRHSQCPLRVGSKIATD